MSSTALKIVDLNRENEAEFKLINLEWVQEMFEVEPIDLKILDNPKQIVADGGAVLFVAHSDHGIVGTGALLHKENGVFELSKMGVYKKARGLKAGEFLLQALIDRAKELKAKELYLLTNSRCEAAIHLYRKNNFIDHTETLQQKGIEYKRCDVAMVYPLDSPIECEKASIRARHKL